MSETPQDGERRRRRWGRRVLALATCAVLVAAAALFALRSGMAAGFLREQLLARLRASLGAARLDRVEVTPRGTVVLHGLRIGDESRTTLRLPVLRIALAPWELLRGRLVFSRVVVADPEIRVVRSAGRWTLPALGDGSSAALPVEIRSMRVRGGEVVIAFEEEPARRVVLADLRLRASVRAAAGRRELHIDGLRFTPQGVDVSPLRVRGAVDRGVEGPTCLRGLRIVSDRSRIVAAGCIDPGRSIDARVSVAPLDAAELRALFPAIPLRSGVDVTIHARGPWQAPHFRARADLGANGTLRGRGALGRGDGGLAWRGRIAFADLDPEAVMGPVSLAGVLPAPAQLRGAAPTGGSVVGPDGPAPSAPAAVGAAAQPAVAAPRARLSGRTAVRGAGWGRAARLSGRVVLEPSQLRGWPVEAAWIRGRHDPQRTRVKARVEAEAGRAALVADAVHAGDAAFDARVRVALRRAELLVPAATGAATARLTVRGAGGDLRAGPAVVHAQVRDLTLRGARIAVARATARVENGMVQVHDLAVSGPQLDASAAGTLNLETRALDATGRARIALAGIGTSGAPPLRGSLSARAEVRGARDDFEVRLQVEGENVGGQMKSLANSLASYLPRDLAIGLGSVRLTVDGKHLGGAGATMAIAASGADVSVGPIARRSARLEADWRQGRPADRTRLFVTATPGEGPAERLRATVRRRGESTEVDVEELLLMPVPELPVRLLRPARAVVAADHVRVVSLELGAGPSEHRVLLDGRFALRGRNEGRLTIEALDLAPLCQAADFGACGGRVAGRLRLAGTAAAPEIAGSAETSNLAVGGVDCGFLDITIDARAATVRLAGALRPPAGDPLEFDARVPADLSWDGPRRDTSRMPLAVSVRSGGLDVGLLGALAAADVRDLGGRMILDVHVAGTRAAPEIAGRAQLTGGWIQPAAAATVFSDIEATLLAEEERLRLVGLRARSGDGMLDGDGTIDLDGGGRFGALALDLRLTDFLAVRTQTLEAAVGGAVQLRGRPEAPVLTGALDVARLALRPVAVEALSAAPLPQPDATIEIAGLPESPAPAPEKGGAGGALDPLHVALDVRLARDAWIRSPEANIELGGELHIEKAPYAAPRVSGKIVLLRGWYAFQGRRFTVKQGTITLPDGGGEPQLDVTGVYRVRATGVAPGYDIFVTVRGPSSAPELTLASEPSLEKGDILSVLLFGKTMDELTAGQATGLQQQTMRLAGQYVIGELGGSVRDGLGLDTLEVGLPEGPQGTGHVTVGRYVTRDVLVSLGHEFGSTVAEVFGLEYGITRSISVRGSTSTEGRSAVDLFWRRRY